MALWKEVAGYEGLYLVSDGGDVIALPKCVRSGDKIIQRRSKALKTHLRGKNGRFYEAVTLSKNGETRSFSVHRLVAESFLPNPDALPEVNHKDENPRNNHVENLEWCTRQYNIDYSKSKPITQISEDGAIVKAFKSIAEASRKTGIGRTSINNALTGWAQSAGGYRWAYSTNRKGI